MSKNRWPLIPDPEPFTPPKQDGRASLALTRRTLQVIAKLANIVLTPDNPRYPGGPWHVEGMLNERIMATGIYYYASENISESQVAFRMTIGWPEPYEMRTRHHKQSDVEGTVAAWGLNGYAENLNQKIGHVAAQDKCIAFLNVYQHCVRPFELADSSKPGHRKILCFFLVDPSVRIASTSDVLPQQRDWSWDEFACHVAPQMPDLPRELYDAIMHEVKDGTIDRAEAMELREGFIDECSKFVKKQGEMHEIAWNMCEH